LIAVANIPTKPPFPISSFPPFPFSHPQTFLNLMRMGQVADLPHDGEKFGLTWFAAQSPAQQSGVTP